MDLSVLVSAYRMRRELPRTIFTLGPDYQRGLGGVEYEIVVVDNGSPQPVAADDLKRLAPNLRVIRVDPASPSPVPAINEAMRTVSGRVVALFTDGAGMASPGLLRSALDAFRTDPTKVIGSLAFHLGPDVQMRSVSAGYDQAVEDRLLESIPWRRDGYSLFSISVLAGSSSEGWFGTLAESNAVFLDPVLWRRLGGLDERFAAQGGGLANLDFWTRSVEASQRQPWIILGEGTFHQLHEGAATNGSDSERKAILDQYARVVRRAFVAPTYRPRFIGSLSRHLAARFGGVATAPPRQARSVRGRAFEVALPSDALENVQAGVLRTTYRTRRLAKSPFDIMLYMRLLERLRPRTIIEVGTSDGGSAIWFRDQCRSFGLACEILTMDKEPLSDRIEGVTFFQVDAARPEETFPHEHFLSAAHPWLVVEDSAHTYPCTTAVLEYFHPLLLEGDYIVVEDGVVADLRAPHYHKYQDGPNRAVLDHLLRWSKYYQIDTEQCDFYGHNVTYCPNAWLMRI